MPETLQTNARRHRENGTPIRPATLILDNNYAAAAEQFVADAVSEIRMTAYAWRWYDASPEIGIQKFNIALLRAKLRGVQVRILVDTSTQAAAFRALGFDTRSVVNTRMLHTKALVIDSKTLVLGSHNLTKRANTDNYECSIAIQDYEPIMQFIDYFDRLWTSRG